MTEIQDSLTQEILTYRSEIIGHQTRLENFGFKVFSQSDEDGIIEEIFRRIGTKNKIFVEFGAEVGQENNTRYLLMQGWKGLWIEGNPGYAPAISYYYEDEIENGNLVFINSFVSAENINDLIESADIKGEIDFLSVDIDGNDYHVFEAISVVEPRVVCLEYNPWYPVPEEWVMPYDPEHRWDHSRNYGASLTSFEKLAKQKGYILVGCGLYSPNSFYVREDIFTPELFPFELGVDVLGNKFQEDKVNSFPVGSHLFVQNNDALKLEREKFELVKDKYILSKQLSLELKVTHHHLRTEISNQEEQRAKESTEYQEEISALTSNLKKSRFDLISIKDYLSTLKEEITSTQEQLTSTQEQLTSTQEQLTSTQEQLEKEKDIHRQKHQRKQSKLQSVRSERRLLSKKCRNLEISMQQLEQENQRLNQEIEAMRTSKFWKLRLLWLKGKRIVKM